MADPCPYDDAQKELGRGTFGRVTLVSQGNQMYALKTVLYQNRINNVEEIDIMSRLQHPHLLSSKDLIVNTECKDLVPQNGLGMLLPLARGDLYTFQAHMDFGQKVKCLYQVASALQFLHEMYYLHLDVKPENVLIDENGNALLADFGLARFREVPDLAIEINGPYGTIPYLAPEVLTRRGFYTEKVDVWAFGMMTLAIFSGSLPTMNAPSNPEITRRDIYTYFSDDKRTTKILENYLQDLPEDRARAVSEFIRPMLEVDPEKRCTMDDILNSNLFQSYGYLKQDIGEVRGDRIGENRVFTVEQTRILRNFLQEVTRIPKVPIAAFFLCLDLSAHSLDYFPLDTDPEIIIAAAVTLALTFYHIEYRRHPKATLQAQQAIVIACQGIINNNYLYASARNIEQLESFRDYISRNLPRYLQFNVDALVEQKPSYFDEASKAALTEDTNYRLGL